MATPRKPRSLVNLVFIASSVVTTAVCLSALSAGCYVHDDHGRGPGRPEDHHEEHHDEHHDDHDHH